MKETEERMAEPVLFAQALKEVLRLTQDGMEPFQAIQTAAERKQICYFETFVDRIAVHFELLREIIRLICASGISVTEAENLMALFVTNLLEEDTELAESEALVYSVPGELRS